MIITQATLDALRTNISLAFQKGYRETVSFSEKIAGKVQSSSATNTYAWLDTIPKFRKWVGPRVYNNLIERAQVVTNEDWEDSLEVKKNHIVDNDLGLYKQKSFLFGKAARKHPDYMVRDMLELGITTVCFDGQFLFDTDHPVNMDDAGAGTQSNKHSLALDATNFNTVLSTAKKIKGADGEPIGAFQDPSKILLVVPTELEKAADEIVTLRTVSTGGDNPNAGKAKVLAIPELTDATRWYILDMSFGDVAAVMLQVRQEVEESEQTENNSEPVFTRNVFRYGLHWRGAAFAGLYWLGATSKP